jgi:hypothetical protein
MAEETVPPGATANFKFPINAPGEEGSYIEAFRPLVEQLAWAEGNPITFSLNVQPPSLKAAKTSEVSPNFNPAPGADSTATIKVINHGNFPWYSDDNPKAQGKPVRLGTYGPYDAPSKFSYGAGWLSSSRIKMVEPEVLPGQEATFTFDLRTPYSSGTLYQSFAVVREGFGWTAPVAHWQFNLQPLTYNYQIISVTPSGQVLSPGQTASVSVVLKNTGSAVWHNDGKTPLRLGTLFPMDADSVFFAGGLPGWAGAKRLIMTDADVAKDQQTTLTFSIKAPAVGGVYVGHFQPLLEHGGRIQGETIKFGVKVE